MKQRTWSKFTVSKSELSRLIGRSIGCIDGWSRYGGLPQTSSGRYHLKIALQWIETHYRQKATIRISLDALDQFQLADLFGVTRQTIHKWVQSGLPRDKNQRFDMQIVCRWLSGRYFAKQEKQNITR